MHADIERKLAQVLAQDGGVRLAVLFGSLADGPGRPDSDVDLAVAGNQALDADTKRRLIDAAAQVSGRPIDLVDLRTAGYFVLRQALVHGRMLYCADQSILAQLRTRMVIEGADFAPYHRRMLRERRRAWIGM